MQHIVNTENRGVVSGYRLGVYTEKGDAAAADAPFCHPFRSFMAG